ncbi:3-methyl-2-oxobutanoate hydroxymethyltransferase [Photorhabdus luminescens subsp. luminescens]|uniref:3-methyl-2-oxobutanoate hydroxymethyltransferase n=1 Tax=Photorhabdus luminescens TaxID=29488 RepID=A0A1G5QJF6_PHOLU|nr:3-methyl-2-oxobutanoate hydroxymethyltransferase [Photorhabdus luminescens]KMW73507.1 3-methyl-2-oxobutanoate hydroxymethyltransferase [Photorhabdus luminescens subsp. luminescens]OWO85647.1 3-methyl-2-oxobutanoate hydroxymethyltransferase [Photorhabdus luminescens]SCZ61995.1 ketopantoate hydroxymethyltransferase [Photorhabdus luminescens]
MKPITMTDLNQLKKEKRKFATITAYDASFAHLFAEQGIDVMLVGDSLGMTVQGADTTIPVTVEDTVYHTRCVRAGAPYTFIIADMPFMSYATPEQSCENAAKLMRAGANMVKLEGGSWLYDTISMLTERSVPVCAHLGLTPQSVHILGGYRVQGRDEESANQLIKDAITLEKAGIQLLVLECVPVDLAKRITDELQIPVIGIGAGNVTDGQVLVMHDVLGITVSPPKFVKNFLEEAGNIRAAIRLYKEQVESGIYPGKEHSFY